MSEESSLQSDLQNTQLIKHFLFAEVEGSVDNLSHMIYICFVVMFKMY